MQSKFAGLCHVHTKSVTWLLVLRLTVMTKGASICPDNHSLCVYVAGDIKADVSESHYLFGNHLKQFCCEGGLILSSKVFFPEIYMKLGTQVHSLITACGLASARASLDAMKINYNLPPYFSYSF